VHLVDEQNDAAIRGGDFGEHSLQPLLEFAAIFRARDQRAEIERHQRLVLEAFGHVAIDDAQRQPLGDRGLADARLADEHRIVLRAARQHLDGAPDFLVTADHRVELARTGIGGEVARVFLQGIVGVFRARAVGSAALAHALDGGVERLRGDARGLQDFFRFRARREQHGKQQALGGHVAVARFLRELLGLIEDLGDFRREIELTRARPFDLRHFRERRLDALKRLVGPALGRADEPGGEAFLVVEQNLQKMFGRETLMPRADRKPLRGLDEAAAPVRVFFQIHVRSFQARQSGSRHAPHHQIAPYPNDPALFEAPVLFRYWCCLIVTQEAIARQFAAETCRIREPEWSAQPGRAMGRRRSTRQTQTSHRSRERMPSA
jgi:hypothetical protein